MMPTKSLFVTATSMPGLFIKACRRCQSPRDIVSHIALHIAPAIKNRDRYPRRRQPTSFCLSGL